MPKTAIKVGPADHGRIMSLADFDHAEVQEGYLYELSRGVIDVSEVPNKSHFILVHAIRQQFYAFLTSHFGVIFSIGAGNECKLLSESYDSERHPDLSIYKTPPPDVADYWRVWIPEIVIEVVSKSSARRDYGEKREEYRDLGISEYWIFDSFKKEMLALRRAKGDWEESHIQSPQLYTTPLLPGFEFSCAKVFAAAEAAS
jgi:hypothetical protein